MHSEQGFEALMSAVFGQGCQSLTVVSNCIPGSPQIHADSEILRISSRDLNVSITRSRSAAAGGGQSPPCWSERMNSSVTRTEWFAFWNCTESYAPPGALNAPS